MKKLVCLSLVIGLGAWMSNSFAESRYIEPQYIEPQIEPQNPDMPEDIDYSEMPEMGEMEEEVSGEGQEENILNAPGDED